MGGGSLINDFEYTKPITLTNAYFNKEYSSIENDGYGISLSKVKMTGYDDIPLIYFEKKQHNRDDYEEYEIINGYRVDGVSISQMLDDNILIEYAGSVNQHKKFKVTNKVNFESIIEDISYSWYGSNSLDGSYTYISDGETCIINIDTVKLRCRVNFKTTINDKKYQFIVDIQVPLS